MGMMPFGKLKVIKEAMVGIRKFFRRFGSECGGQKLYAVLMSGIYRNERYHWDDLNEGMESVSFSVLGWWKQRYLLDHNIKVAYEIMSETLCWSHFRKSDIAWLSLDGLSEEAVCRAKSLKANFPSIIREFKNGVAEISWQLIPNECYYMDEDGFGMTDSTETTIYAMIDRQLNVLERFRFIDEDYTQLEKMRNEAESIVREKSHRYNIKFNKYICRE